MDKKIVFGGLGILAVTIVLFNLIAFIPTESSSTATNTFTKGSSITIEVIREGKVIDREESHNVFYNIGANNTRDILGNGASYGAFNNISLCNASAGCTTPAAAASETFNQYSSCGLSPAAGTYATVVSSNGNWTINKVFTATCDNILTNTTRLMNSTGGLFAGAAFTIVTLQTNDQLNLTWNNWVA